MYLQSCSLKNFFTSSLSSLSRSKVAFRFFRISAFVLLSIRLTRLFTQAHKISTGFTSGLYVG